MNKLYHNTVSSFVYLEILSFAGTFKLDANFLATE